MEFDATQLGRKIKQERLKRGLTLKEIESKVGISATHVSEIERGRTSPTVGALAKIAAALDTKMSLLVDLRTPPPLNHTSPRDRAPYQVRMGALTAEPLFPFLSGPEVSLLVLQMPVGEKDPTFLAAADGEVFLFNMKGIVEVNLSPTERFVLREGDTIHFGAKAGQTLENIGESAGKLLAAVAPRMSV